MTCIGIDTFHQTIYIVLTPLQDMVIENGKNKM